MGEIRISATNAVTIGLISVVSLLAVSFALRAYRARTAAAAA